MKRRLAVAAAALVVLAVALAAGVGFLVMRIQQRAAARLAELEAADLGADDTPAGLCAVYERERLRAGDLAVDCAKATVVPTVEGVVRLEGAVRTRNPEQALLGGGFRTPVCLGRGPDGWTLMGDAFELRDCQVSREGGAAEAHEVERSAALALIDRVRAADRAVGEACPAGLGSVRPLTLVQSGLLDGVPGDYVHSGTPFGACLQRELVPGSCSLREAPDFVLLLVEDRVDPRPVGPDTYAPGAIHGRMVLVEATTGRALCGRPWEVELADPTVFGWLPAAWKERQRDALRAGVGSMGDFRLDPWWDQPG